MKKEKLIELSEKLGFNQEAVEHYFKTNKKAAEKQITSSAKFMGLIK